MSKHPTPEHLDTFVRLVIRSLPDSISERKHALITLLALLPKDYPHRSWVKELLHHLHAHEQAQLRFPL